MKTNLANWFELTTCFDLIIGNVPCEQRSEVRAILKLLKDPANFLFFTFLTPEILQLEKISMMFQTRDVQSAANAYDSLSQMHKSLKRRVKDSGGSNLPLMEVDLGIIFKNDCLKFIQGHLFPDVKLSKDEKLTKNSAGSFS